MYTLLSSIADGDLGLLGVANIEGNPISLTAPSCCPFFGSHQLDTGGTVATVSDVELTRHQAGFFKTEPEKRSL